MGQLLDTLKVAKFVSRYLKKDVIDIEAIEIAHCFFKPNRPFDNLLTAAYTDFVVVNPLELENFLR